VDEYSIKEEARIYAIEYMVMLLSAKIHLIHGHSLAKVREIHLGQRQMLNRETFQLDDPAESDHFAAEVQTAVEKLLFGIEEMLERVKGQ
jgi:hypothetical protein